MNSYEIEETKLDGNIKKPRKYDREDSKRRLMRAASQVFSKWGYDAATTRAISQKAGVNEALIQKYFQNKLGLFSAVLKNFQNELFEELPYPAQICLSDELRSFFLMRLSFVKTRKILVRMILMRVLVDRTVRDQMRNLHQDGMVHLIKRFEKLQEDGKMTKDINLVHLSQIAGGFSFTLSLMIEIIGTLDASLKDELVSLTSKLLSKGLIPE